MLVYFVQVTKRWSFLHKPHATWRCGSYLWRRVWAILGRTVRWIPLSLSSRIGERVARKRRARLERVSISDRGEMLRVILRQRMVEVGLLRRVLLFAAEFRETLVGAIFLQKKKTYRLMGVQYNDFCDRAGYYALSGTNFDHSGFVVRTEIGLLDSA